MKIMLIVPEYPPYHIGGGGIVYKNLAENLCKFGHEVIVLWGYYPTKSILEKSKLVTKDRIKFIRIPEIPYDESKPFLRTAMPPNLRSLFSIPQVIKKEKPDIIHLHGYGLLLINYSSIISKFQNIPNIFTIHGYPKTPELNTIMKLIWFAYEKTIMMFTLNNTNMITCVSNWIASDSRLKIFKNKIKVIYNGINQAQFKNKRFDNNINLYKKFNLPENAQLICSVGRISKMKGFHNIIKTIPSLLNDFQNLYYVIIGDDDGYRFELEKLVKTLDIEQHIIFTGFIDRSLKNRIIQKSDAYIVPSLWEPFGLTALEGLAMKKVVITSGAGGLEEFLSDSQNVIFYDNNDSNSIISAIKKRLNHEKSYKEEEFLNRFHWNKITREYENIYREIVNKNIKKS